MVAAGRAKVPADADAPLGRAQSMKRPDDDDPVRTGILCCGLRCDHAQVREGAAKMKDILRVPRGTSRGFTLVEVLTTVAIIAVLTALIVPSVQ